MSDIIFELDEAAKRRLAIAPQHIPHCLEYLAAREIESLRQQVKELEEKNIAIAASEGTAWHHNDKLEKELATLKESQGEPVAWKVIAPDGYETILRSPTTVEWHTNIPLYTSAPSIPEGWQIVPIEPNTNMEHEGKCARHHARQSNPTERALSLLGRQSFGIGPVAYFQAKVQCLQRLEQLMEPHIGRLLRLIREDLERYNELSEGE